jgi:hypothetical protein
MLEIILNEIFDVNHPIQIRYNGNYEIYEKKSLSFLLALDLNEIPRFLNAILKEKSSSGYGKAKDGHFIKGPLNEWEGPTLKESEIYVFSFNDGETIELNEYMKIVLKFAHKSIEAVTWYGLLDKGIVDENWLWEVNKWILNYEINEI